MFGKLRKHRSYQYTPRFYKPEEDKERKPRIRIRRSGRSAQYRSVLYLLVTIAFLMYVLYLLSRIGK